MLVDKKNLQEAASVLCSGSPSMEIGIAEDFLHRRIILRVDEETGDQIGDQFLLNLYQNTMSARSVTAGIVQEAI